MILTELYNLLSSIEGFSNRVTYHSFPAGNSPGLPFICYLVTGSDNFKADSQVYKSIIEVDIELYTEKKDLQSERKIENALNNAGISWDKTEEYIDDEHCFEIIYTITIQGD